MSTRSLAQSGFIQLPIILLGFIIIGTTFFIGTQTIDQPKVIPLTQTIPSPTIEPTLSPSTSPAEQLSPSPTPTSKPSIAPTIKPTPAPVSTTGVPGNGYGYATVVTDRGTFKAHIITLNNPTMVTDAAGDSDCDNDCPAKPLADYVTSNGGFAGIHGTYFCPPDYADCSSKKNTFDFPIYISRLSKWAESDKLGWNDRAIVYQDGNGFHYLPNASTFNGGLNAGVINYPGLLDNGQITVNQDPLSDKLRSKGTKGGIGINGNKVFLVVANSVDTLDFATLFKTIGATSALNLDGGGSVAMYYGGRYVVGPGRALPNAIIFK